MGPASETLVLHLFDSRRQVGPNLLHDGAGAALELVWGEDRSAQPGGDFEVPAPPKPGAPPAPGAAPAAGGGPGAGGGRPTEAATCARVDAVLDRAVGAWERWARALLDGVGWERERLFVRRFAGRNQSDGPLRGATLALSAPDDGLWTATEIDEWAVAAAAAELRGEAPDLAGAIAAMRASLAKEGRRRVHLVALQAEARRRGLSCLADDRLLSLGTGAGSRSFELGALPDPAEVDWPALRDVPVVFVTGTNGKTTTVRLVHAIGLAAGLVAGHTSTDWIRVGTEVIEQGDCAGPDASRRLLRDRRVELAICETARGGILRRGLVPVHAAAAVVTNVAEDHLGQWGVLDLDGMGETKAVVGRLVAGGGPTGRAPLVLNADDAQLRARGAAHDGPVAWFTLVADNPLVAAHVAAGGTAARLEREGGREVLVLRRGARGEPVLAADELPVALGGAARHNLANALAAILVADALGLPLAAMRSGLCGFVPDAAANPGRGNRYELNGVVALADFAHNVHSMTAFAAMVAALPASRRLLVLGQAGDRSDEKIRELVRTAWSARPDRVIVKEQVRDLRGRQPGEVPAVIEDELRRCGAPAGTVSRAPSELDAVREALAWARPGDLLALFLHSQRDEGLALLDTLAATGWRPGEPLPPVPAPAPMA